MRTVRRPRAPGSPHRIVIYICYHPDVAWNTTQVDGTSSAPTLTRAFRRYPPGAGLLAIVEQRKYHLHRHRPHRECCGVREFTPFHMKQTLKSSMLDAERRVQLPVSRPMHPS